MKNQTFVDLVRAEKIVPEEQFSVLEKKYEDDSMGLLDHLVYRGVAPKSVLGRLWGDSLGYAFVDLDKTIFQSEIVFKMPADIARQYRMIPIYQVGATITVSTPDPANREAFVKAEKAVGLPLSPVFSLPTDVDDAIDIYYQTTNAVEASIGNLAAIGMLRDSARITTTQLSDLAENQSVVDLCRSILLLGIKEGATDIHFEPGNKLLRVRFRVDGVLLDKVDLDKVLLAPLASRLMMMAGVEISKRKTPQTGRLKLELKSRMVDFGFSSIPTIHGVKIVLKTITRIKKATVPDISELALSVNNANRVQKVIESPYGFFVLAGPAGSGKTTTLFSLLKEINQPRKNILTIEDPVEYTLNGINQLQLNRQVGMTPSGVLEAMLLQDPDVIMIGEIRDVETARLCAQAAPTGRLVLGAMVAGKAREAVTRMLGMGVEPYLLAMSLIGVMSQRLVRRLCAKCREPYKAANELLNRYFRHRGDKEVTFYRAKGCPECHHTGYAGMLGIHEFMLLNDEMREAINAGDTGMKIEQAARKRGFTTYRYDGMKKVVRGLTSLEEFERVTIADEVLPQ
jgi:type IV pilus assembly protein PilB